MITVILPEWFVYFLAALAALHLTKEALGGVIWYLKRKFKIKQGA